jgi:hypothetical protein
MQLKKGIALLFIVFFLSINSYAQNGPIIREEKYKGPSFHEYDSEITIFTDFPKGNKSAYLKFISTFDPSDIKDIINNLQQSINIRDTFAQAEHDVIFHYFIKSDIGLELRMTFYWDSDSRCEIFLKDKRKIYMVHENLEELEGFFKKHYRQWKT